jgi:hypothetical protein
MNLEARFKEVIKSESEVRAILGSPGKIAVKKALPHMNEHHQAMIRRSPFILIATYDATGMMDISPKGDPEGFVTILDSTTIAIPDRPGNRRADTITNLLTNDRIAVLFLIPGKGESLRISGRAIVVRDIQLRDAMKVQGKTPELAIVVEAEEAFSHCARCVIRSNLWSPEHWPKSSDLPSHAEALLYASQVPVPLDELTNEVQIGYKERLY